LHSLVSIYYLHLFKQTAKKKKKKREGVVISPREM